MFVQKIGSVIQKLCLIVNFAGDESHNDYSELFINILII